MSSDPTMPESPIEELVHRLMLGELSESERVGLAERLKHDSAARETYGSMLEMEAMLHHEFPRLPEFREPAPMVRRPPRGGTAAHISGGRKRTSHSVAVSWGIAAAFLICIAGWWLLFKPEPAPVLVEGYGGFSWVDAAGRKHPISIGGRLGRNGALTTEGSGSFAKLRFSDGSTVVLSGEGELKVPAEKAKRLVLRSGILEIEMSPQPKGRPAHVETSTARVEVVGTRFSVDASWESTTVAVSSGKVKMERLADGETAEIPKDRMATATLDVRTSLEARVISSVPVLWRAIAPAEGWFDAQPFRAGGSSEKPVVHQGIVFRPDGGRVFDGIAELEQDSRLRMKFQVADPSALVRIFVHCQDGKGNFVGNRQIEFRASKLPADADGWRIYEGRLEDLKALSPAGGFSISGSRVANLTISVLNPPDGLRLAEAEIRG